MKLHYKSKKSILAFGVDGKARFAFANGSDIEISRDFGSLQDAGNFERYERSIKQLIKKEKPQILACDLHPEYNSTKLAKKLYGLQATGYRLQAIQHHHAHIASCIADNGLTSRVIGVAFDGTGFGIDGNIWGGEIFLATPTKFRRVWHLDYVPMPGAEAAVKEPWRMALSYLYKYYGDRFLNLKIPFVKSISKNKVLVLKKMIKKGINSPLTSSIGRLFDAAGALINLTNSVRYEGEAAIRLEALAAARIEIKSYYKASVHTRDLIRGIVNDLKRGADKAEIAVKFHNSIARMIYDVSKRLSKAFSINKVALSGGVFQNKILLDRTKELFDSSGIRLYIHKNIPATDFGLSVGQAVIAAGPVRNDKFSYSPRA